MRIFYSPLVEAVVLDTVSGLEETAEKLDAFLDSGERIARLAAHTHGTPAPYDRFLRYLEIQKGDKKIAISLTTDGGLLIRGPVDLLRRYIEGFRVREHHGHNHPEFEFRDGESVFQAGSLSPYVQADNDYETEKYWLTEDDETAT